MRELALRFTAERVDEQVLLHRQGEGIQQTWPTVERLLVCVGSDEGSTKVVRAARRMATGLHASWIAINVETPRQPMTEQQRNSVTQNLRLAEQLGAVTRNLTGIDVVKEIIMFARHHNVTKIVIGKRLRSRWYEFLFNSLAMELIRRSGEIDVYVIRSSDKTKRTVYASPVKRKTHWLGYFVALSVTVCTTLLNFLIHPYVGMVGSSNLLMIYLMGVIIVALRSHQQGPAIFAAVLSALSFTYFFVPPRFVLASSDAQYVLTFLIMILVAQTISRLTIINRHEAEIANLAEQRTAALHALTRQLASTRGTTKLLDIAMRYISEVFDCEVLVLLHENGELHVRAASAMKKNLNAKNSVLHNGSMI